MNLKQTAYFMALVGASAGLVCWLVQTWLGSFVLSGQREVTLVTALLMGALIGGLTVAFADRWTADRVVGTWVVAGAVLGGVAGLAGGGVYQLMIAAGVMEPGSLVADVLGLPLLWMITGGLIGFVTGLRWFGVNRLRAIHALLGGLVGGALGGVLFRFLGTDPFFNALAYMLSGLGVTLGVTLAPMLLRDGVLFFVSSADPRAQNKYGSPPQEWVVQDGDRFVLGSQGSSAGMTMYTRPVDIYIPDAMVAKRHAVLFASNRRFFIQQHAENAGPQGQPLATLQVNRTNVAGTRELHNGDEIVVGQTLLRFTSRRQTPAVPGPSQGGM
jgi:hypothetical protein